MMDQIGWAWPTDVEEASRRAGGRRRFNSVRRLRAELRRAEVAHLALELGYGIVWGAGAEIARRLGVSRATVCLDVRELLRRVNENPGPFPGGRRRR
jgi:hypothetical protein